MQKHAAAHPGVYLEKSRSFHFFDVNGFALIQHGEVHGHVNSFHKSAHERKSDAGDIEIGLGVAAEAENFQAEAITASFRIAAQITAALEGPKDVAGGTFGNGELAADFRIRKTVAAVGGGFENVKGALDGGGGT